MSNVFKNYTAEGVTTETTVYTVPVATTAIMLGMNLANISAGSITVTAKLGTTVLVKDAPIPVGSALSLLDGKIVAEAADTIIVTATGTTDVVLSVMEQS